MKHMLLEAANRPGYFKILEKEEGEKFLESLDAWGYAFQAVFVGTKEECLKEQKERIDYYNADKNERKPRKAYKDTGIGTNLGDIFKGLL